MRYQEPIYIQNESNGVRNRDILNVNMSSDVCVFANPQYSVSGASKIDCTGTTTSYIFSSTATTLPLEFNFTGNTTSFTANNATFKYEIYKFNDSISAFTQTPILKSSAFTYNDINYYSSNTLNQSIALSGLSLDGEFLIKGYYVFEVCTDFLQRLGKVVDTLEYRNGTSYGLYNQNQDFYFLAMYEAEKPQFLPSSSNTPPASKLFQQIILPDIGTTIFAVSNSVAGNFIVTLNGLVLAPNLDYTYSGNIVTLSSETVVDDIITIIYNTTGGNNLNAENINVVSEIVSGTTGNQTNNRVYYNVDSNKFEIYTTSIPEKGGNIIVMINGATLANGVDYYQSISDPKRIILEGDVIVGDIITIVYYPLTNVVNGLNTNTPLIAWAINRAPQKVNGVFTLEVSTGSSFSTIYTSASVNYVVNQNVYSSSVTISGTIGTQYYYRIKNDKNYVNICGDLVNSVTYSDIIPITIQTNAINSY